MTNIPTLEDFQLMMDSSDDNTKLAYYQTFLLQTDYIAAKMAEAMYTGRKAGAMKLEVHDYGNQIDIRQLQNTD